MKPEKREQPAASCSAEWRDHTARRLRELSNEIQVMCDDPATRSTLGLCDLHDLNQAAWASDKAAQYVEWSLRIFRHDTKPSER